MLPNQSLRQVHKGLVWRYEGPFPVVSLQVQSSNALTYLAVEHWDAFTLTPNRLFSGIKGARRDPFHPLLSV
uniref:Uncharacterized protein n=1 Tax=Utricularia reniformis TaxID=192314 RepID=A0A1Y0B4H0_9LAMI|nr:hypothetical protein AEK19_MT2211 [Utricularia reniformis]ART32356.1 hypothetical protein AEK19_MT2211 [Utricularia reniformis]